jgi:predicted O-linked N-acetylglucosamine transferase (SPINDLY family)
VFQATELFDTALHQFQQGALSQAAVTCQQVVATDPQHAAALHLLGAIAHRWGRFGVAVDYFHQAVQAEPQCAGFHSSLGATYQALGRLDQARVCHEQARQLAPTDPTVLNNLGITLSIQKDHAAAVAAFEASLRIRPQDPETLNNLAAALRSQGQAAQALGYLDEVLRLRPNLPHAHNNLGNALRDEGRLDEAIACYRRALELWPGFALARSNLGLALRTQGQVDAAIEQYHQAVQVEPDNSETLVRLGETLLMKNALGEAVQCLQRAVQLRPDSVDALNGLGNAYHSGGRLDEAEACYRRALEVDASFTPARYNLGLTCKGQGRLAEARTFLEQVLQRKPDDHVAHGTYLGLLNYDPGVEPATLRAEHERWAARHAPGPAEPVVLANDPDPERCLRVGYVSPDFRAHAVSYFLEAILKHHDPRQVRSFAYAEVPTPDQRTAHLRSLVHEWRLTCGLSDEDLVRLIRQDQIDILVDLAGHTAGNRLRVFGRRAAPIQISYLGYPCTSGLPQMDYRLVDAVTDPPGEPSAFSEELVRLPRVFACYTPPALAPEVAPPPAQRSGVITFGSLHKLEKLNPLVLDLWSQLLQDIPESRLLLGRDTLDGQTGERLLHGFEERGVPKNRLFLYHATSEDMQHLRVYEAIDVALDPFPWNGHTTACEALWMGVPVIALRGRRHAARMVASVLTAVGLAELVAETAEDYRRIAYRLAENLEHLAQLRQQLRGQMAESPLCNGPAFTAALEDCYRQLWRKWCHRVSHVLGGWSRASQRGLLIQVQKND